MYNRKNYERNYNLFSVIYAKAKAIFACVRFVFIVPLFYMFV